MGAPVGLLTFTIAVCRTFAPGALQNGVTRVARCAELFVHGPKRAQWIVSVTLGFRVTLLSFISTAVDMEASHKEIMDALLAGIHRIERQNEVPTRTHR